MVAFTPPRLPLDQLLSRAALRHPGKDALVTEHGALTYAQLDHRADAIARYLQRRTAPTRRPGGRRAAIGVASTLDTVFPAAYYGTVRSGHIAVLVNPLISPLALHHVFTAASIEIAFVPAATAHILASLRESLPRLHTLIVTDTDPDPAKNQSGGAGVLPPGAVGLRAALAGQPGQDRRPARPRRRTAADPHDIAAVQFTTGTTGPAKGVLLTHRNLVANAAQIAHAHRLGPHCLTLNHLPLFHVMHLNSAVFAGATQILCRQADPLAALELAAEAGATHYYTLPARLHRLAADPRLDTAPPGVPATAHLRAILSGGSALAPAAARRLRRALGVPVIQGYGMAELSPLSHTQRPGDHDTDTDTDEEAGERGCVGRPLPATQCRIVDPQSHRPLQPGAVGEVQVRGPQVMAGYLDAREPTGIDAQGWLSTGDIGFLTAQGALCLVDRLGDVFTYDNELISPSAVEQLLAKDPRVADCIVAGRPDPVHGAVVWAGITLHPNHQHEHEREGEGEREREREREGEHEGESGPGAPSAVLASITAQANARLSHAEQIRHAELLQSIPRTPAGKPRRTEIRQRLRAHAATAPQPSPSSPAPPPPFTADPQESHSMVFFVNKLTVHGDHDTFLALRARLTAFMTTQPGYLGHQHLRRLGEAENIYLELAQWQDAAAHRAAFTSPAFQQLLGELRPLVTAEPALYEPADQPTPAHDSTAPNDRARSGAETETTGVR